MAATVEPFSPEVSVTPINYSKTALKRPPDKNGFIVFSLKEVKRGIVLCEVAMTTVLGQMELFSIDIILFTLGVKTAARFKRIAFFSLPALYNIFADSHVTCVRKGLYRGKKLNWADFAFVLRDSYNSIIK